MSGLPDADGFYKVSVSVPQGVPAQEIRIYFETASDIVEIKEVDIMACEKPGEILEQYKQIK